MVVCDIKAQSRPSPTLPDTGAWFDRHINFPQTPANSLRNCFGEKRTPRVIRRQAKNFGCIQTLNVHERRQKEQLSNPPYKNDRHAKSAINTPNHQAMQEAEGGTLSHSAVWWMKEEQDPGETPRGKD